MSLTPSANFKRAVQKRSNDSTLLSATTSLSEFVAKQLAMDLRNKPDSVELDLLQAFVDILSAEGKTCQTKIEAINLVGRDARHALAAFANSYFMPSFNEGMDRAFSLDGLARIGILENFLNQELGEYLPASDYEPTKDGAEIKTSVIELSSGREARLSTYSKIIVIDRYTFINDERERIHKKFRAEGAALKRTLSAKVLSELEQAAPVYAQTAPTIFDSAFIDSIRNGIIEKSNGDFKPRWVIVPEIYRTAATKIFYEELMLGKDKVDGIERIIFDSRLTNEVYMGARESIDVLTLSGKVKPSVHAASNSVSGLESGIDRSLEFDGLGFKTVLDFVVSADPNMVGKGIISV